MKARVIWRARSERKLKKMTASPSAIGGVPLMRIGSTNSSVTPLRVARLQRLDRIVEHVAGEVAFARGGEQAVRRLRARPPVVAVHRVVAPDDGPDPPHADSLGLLLEVADVLRAALRIGVAPVGEGVDDHVVRAEPLALREVEERVEVAEVGVDATVGEEAHQVESRAVRHRVGDRLTHDGVLEEGALGDVLIDPRDLLIDHAPRAEVHVPDLRVAHLPLRQPDGEPRRLQGRVRVLRKEAIEERLRSRIDGRNRRVLGDAEAVEDEEEMAVCHGLRSQG